MKKIGIDLTCLGKEEVINHNIVSGIGTWLSEILDFIIAQNRQCDYILMIDFYSKDFLTERFPGFEVSIFGGYFSELVFKYTGKSMEMMLKKFGFNSRKINKCKEIDVLWFPFAIPEIVYTCNKRVILTIHDFMKCKSNVEKERYEKMIESADKIITISQYVKNNFLQLFSNYRSCSLSVIPNSISVGESMEHCKYEPNSEYILDINRYANHKNAITLLKAFEKYIKCNGQSTLKLIFIGIGDKSYYNKMVSTAQNMEIEDRVLFLWGIEETDKNWLLKHAKMFVSPSTNEGLGRTPIEAMLCKVPVITTKETALYEATLGLAYYVDNPFDDNELCDLMEKIINNPPSDKKLEQIKNKVRNEYSVEIIEEKYREIFNELC